MVTFTGVFALQSPDRGLPFPMGAATRPSCLAPCQGLDFVPHRQHLTWSISCCSPSSWILWALQGGYLSLTEAVLMQGQKCHIYTLNLMIELSGVWILLFCAANVLSELGRVWLEVSMVSWWLLRKRIALPLGLGDFLFALS